MAHSPLSAIHNGSNQWTICALVSRMWHYRGGTDEGPIRHTDLVLLDTEGNHMYAEIPATSVDRFKDVLEEGKVFVIRKFLCNLSRPSFRAVESPFMVQFTRYTIAEPRPGLEDTFPFCTYNLCAFTDIPDPSLTPTRFIDVIGKISGVSDVIPVQSMYQPTASNTRTISLTDLLGNELRLVLWGDRAVEFDADSVRAMGEKEPVIAIFVGTLPKIVRGVKGLSGSSACRWYIDEDIPDINSFRESLGGQFSPLSAYTPVGLDAIVPRVYEDPIEKTVQKLNDVDPFEDMEKRFICTVTIDRLGSDQRWWFASCSICRRSSKFDGHQFACSGLDCPSIKPILTYCITVFASDGTGEAEFVLFDRVAAGAVGRPLAALLRKRYPGHNTPEDIAIAARHDTGVPAEISSLVGRKFKFLVCISKKWSSKNNSYSSDDSLSFQVSRIEEAYKPELPPLISGNAAGSGEASSSAGGLGANVPHLGAAISTARHTPSAPASVSKQGLRPGQGSPMGKVSASPAGGLVPLTPAKGASAPRRGARRSLFRTPPKVNPQRNVNDEVPAEDETDGLGITSSSAQGEVDNAASEEDKNDAVLLSRTKRTATSSKTGGSGKKTKAQ